MFKKRHKQHLYGKLDNSTLRFYISFFSLRFYISMYFKLKFQLLYFIFTEYCYLISTTTEIFFMQRVIMYKKKQRNSWNLPTNCTVCLFDFLFRTVLLGFIPHMLNNFFMYNLQNKSPFSEKKATYDKPIADVLILRVEKPKMASSQRNKNSLLAKVFILTWTKFFIYHFHFGKF